MRLVSVSDWKSHPRILLGAVLALLLVATVLHFADPFGDDSSSPNEANLSSQGEAARRTVTRTRIASFNLLGAGHTDAGGDRRGWASGAQRMVWSMRIIRNQNLDVVGFQEMHQPQFNKFKSLTGNKWGIYPGDKLGPAAVHNSIIWRKNTWEAVETNWIHIPYFKGNLIRMPYVLLRQKKTGQLAWFANFHNPANTHGNGRKWRAKATRIQIDLANRLRRDYPGIPVHFTGDFNERQLYFCPVVRETALRASNGGSSTKTKCTPPNPMWVDWVFGSKPTTFTSHRALRSKLVKKTTDHPVIIAGATITSGASMPPKDTGVRRVVVISVEGLRGDTPGRLAKAGTTGIPYFTERGAFTYNARTAYTRTTQLPNAVSMLTGRSVTAQFGGHGVSAEKDNGRTIHQMAGSYVDSVFDLVHDSGRATALFSQDRDMAMVRRSYDANHGAPDQTGVDNGRNKITTYFQRKDLAAVTDAAVRQLRTSPKAFTFIQFNALDRIAHRYGYNSARYLRKAKDVDRQIRRIRIAINRTKALKGKTLVVITSEHGGKGTKHNDPALLANHKVPFVVWGPSVPAKTNLYRLNPLLASAGRKRPGYNETQPVRNIHVANLVTTALGLALVPGSNVSPGESLNAFRR